MWKLDGFGMAWAWEQKDRLFFGGMQRVSCCWFKTFDPARRSHMADAFIISCWFMLREIEIAGALQHHLTLEADEVRLLIPVHKTSSSGSLTSRSLRCPCRTVIHRLCPWHAKSQPIFCLIRGSVSCFFCWRVVEPTLGKSVG